MKRKKIRCNYRINKEIKEKIEEQKKFKNFSYFIRQAVLDFIQNPITIDEIGKINEELEKKNNIITSTVLLFDEDIENINKIKSKSETYNYDTVYLLAIILYNYANKKNLINS